MQSFLIALSALFAIMGTAAHAGCAVYTDGSLPDTQPPRYLICYDAACDITTQDYVCANANCYQAGYAIGWAVDCQIDADGRETCAISWQNRPVDPAKHDRITFTELPD